MEHFLAIRLLCQNFIEVVNKVTNGVTLVCPFERNPDNDLTEDLSQFLLNGEFTKQVFLIDRLAEVYSHADFDADLEIFVYPEKSNCFAKEPLELDMHPTNQEEVIKTYIELLTSPKSPYKKQVQTNEASDIVHHFIRTLKEKEQDENPRYYTVQPNFLFAQGDSMRKELSDHRYYFDQGHFDSCIIIQFSCRSYLVLTNGSP